MLPKTPKLIEDIRDAAAFVADVTRGVSEDDYQSNRMLRQSVERNFEIIGEAMRRLAQDDPATAQGITGHAQIIAFRNILIHGYVSLITAWSGRSFSATCRCSSGKPSPSWRSWMRSHSCYPTLAPPLNR